MSNRERLIEELRSIKGLDSFNIEEKIADFILARDKRIVEPLNRLPNQLPRDIKQIYEAIEETLKLAGGE